MVNRFALNHHFIPPNTAVFLWWGLICFKLLLRHLVSQRIRQHPVNSWFPHEMSQMIVIYPLVPWFPRSPAPRGPRHPCQRRGRGRGGCGAGGGRRERHQPCEAAGAHGAGAHGRGGPQREVRGTPWLGRCSRF